MSSKKKKVLYHSDFSLLKTGFGKVSRLVLSYLYQTGKYDIVHLCCGLEDNNSSYTRLPWKSVGALPSSESEVERVKNDPKLAQLASYGAMKIDEVVKEEKPDVYIGVQDIWGCEFATKKGWWRDSNMAIWTTLDSLPILPMAVRTAEKIKNFWCWSDFATESLHDLGHKHVKTLRGPLDESNFYKLDSKSVAKIRNKAGIHRDTFVVGFVFRNQLRKSVPNLLEGFKKFLDNNPSLASGVSRGGGAKLLLHTNFSEGWNIQKLAAEHNLNANHILTTYVCSACGKYHVNMFVGNDQDCPFCKTKKSFSTTGITCGVTEKQLNEVYNLMDVYCHPFTSGGQEIPIQEAKLVEIPTLVTNYSCGVDSCKPESASLPLKWSEYREHGTEFIKASTDPNSIAEQLQKVYEMSTEKRAQIGKAGRQWVIDNFAFEKIGKEIEAFIDSCPDINVDEVYSFKSNQNPLAKIDRSLLPEQRIISMYKNILDMEVNESDQGVRYWMQQVGDGKTLEEVEDFFRATARQEIDNNKNLLDYLSEEDDGKKILYVIPGEESDVFLSTSLFESLHETYPDHKLFVATNKIYFDILSANEYVHKVLPYDKSMYDVYSLEGFSNRRSHVSKQEKIFDIVFVANTNTSIVPNYTRNGVDKITFDIKK